MKEPFKDNNHLILIVGDNPNHRELDFCELTKTWNEQYIDDLWFDIYDKVLSIK